MTHTTLVPPTSHDPMSRDPMSHDPMSHDPMSHDEAWELLPWLATDRLTPEQLRGVLHHLEHSPALRQELRYLTDLERAVTHPDAETFGAARSHASAERVLRRIDRLAEKPPSTTVSSRLRTLVAQLGRQLSTAARSPLVATQAAVIAVLLFLLVTPTGGGLPGVDGHVPTKERAATYRTLSDAPTPVVADDQAPKIRLVVDADLSVGALGALLDATHATVVDGPRVDTPGSAHRLLTLALPPDEPVDEALDTLRATPSVAFAERAHGML